MTFLISLAKNTLDVRQTRKMRSVREDNSLIMAARVVFPLGGNLYLYIVIKDYENYYFFTNSEEPLAITKPNLKP